jgi:hypothetical protein
MMKPLQTHRIITIQQPGLWWLGLITVISLILLMIWSAFEYGRYVAAYAVDFNKADADAYIEQLQEKLEKSQEEIIETKRQATMLERNSRIDVDASVLLKETLAQTQSEVVTLKKELSFYKSIVAPEQGSRSLAIQKMQVKANVAGGYDYKIMVSQRGRNDQYARGIIDVSIEGLSKGKPATLTLAEVSNDTGKFMKSGPMKFGFKYFQNFEGVIILPETFVPDIIRVKVKPGKGKIKAIDEQFSWSELTTEGA